MEKTRSYQPETSLINIGGRHLHLTCDGNKLPLVIFESGMGSTWESWLSIQPHVAQFARVYSYDRAGLGKSDPAPTPRTCQNMVDDLRSLLDAAKVEPPYVLVAHSYGGMNVRLFASQYPQDILGMVLVDSVHEDRHIQFETVLSNDLMERQRNYLADPSRNSENIDEVASSDQLRAAKCKFDFPIVVLSCMHDPPSDVWPMAALRTVWEPLQFELAQLSSKGKHVFAQESGHFIHHDEPELVIDAIQEVIVAVQ